MLHRRTHVRAQHHRNGTGIAAASCAVGAAFEPLVFAVQSLPDVYPTSQTDFRGVAHASAAAKGNVLYVVGGQVLPGSDPTGDVWLYNVVTDAWAEGALAQRCSALGVPAAASFGVAGAKMPTARSYGCLATVGSNLLYSGASYSQTVPNAVTRAVEMIVGTPSPTPAPTTAAPTTASPTSVALEPWSTKRKLPAASYDGAYSCAGVGAHYYHFIGQPSTDVSGLKYATATDAWTTGALAA